MITSFYSRIVQTLLYVIVLLCVNIAVAADVSSFTITVNPNPFTVDEPVDMTITALDANGAIVKDYDGTVIIDFEQAQDSDVYELPSNGFYEFVAADQGVKTFSKGLIIHKSGVYTLKVFDITALGSNSPEVAGSVSITVNPNKTTSSQPTSGGGDSIDIQEPFSDAEISASSLNVIGVTSNRRTPLIFYIDGEAISSGYQTDDSGVFSVYLTNIEEGKHLLRVEMQDVQGNVLGISDDIPFTYIHPAFDDFLHNFVASPDGHIQLGESILFSALTDTTVRSIEIIIDDDKFVMDKTGDGSFEKLITPTKAGTYFVDIVLVFENGQRQDYKDRVTLDIEGSSIAIGILKIVNDAADPTKAQLSWNSTGDIAGYIVRYGRTKEMLSNEVKVTSSQVEVSGLEIGKEYYFQVFAMDDKGNAVGIGSDIAMILTQGQNIGDDQTLSGPSCTIVGIDIRTEQRGDKYFLVRDAISGAVEYHIYKSDYKVDSIEDMQKISSVSIPQFEYPFDANAQQDEYTYYAVVATCSDGTELQIDNIKRVHTGPVEDMVLILFIAILIYMLYRIYRYNE